MSPPDERSEPEDLGATPEEPPPHLLHELPPVLKVLGQVVAPATLITALLIFFGWSHTTALFGWFGIDPTSLGFSSTDYLLTSQDGLFLPGVVITLLVLVATRVLALVRRSGRTADSPPAWVAPAVATVGALLTANGVLGLFRQAMFGNVPAVAPLCLVVGVTLLGTAGHLIRAPAPSYSRGVGIAELTALTLVIAMGLFWAAGDYSAAVGRQRAAELAASLHNRAQVVLYSDKLLDVSAPGVRTVRCGGEPNAYRYRYSGLVLLLNSDSQYVFLPTGWTRAAGSAIAVPKSSQVRLDYRSAGAVEGTLPASC